MIAKCIVFAGEEEDAKELLWRELAASTAGDPDPVAYFEDSLLGTWPLMVVVTACSDAEEV